MKNNKFTVDLKKEDKDKNSWQAYIDSRENRILSKRSFLTNLPSRPLTSKQINSQVNYSTSRNNLCNCNQK